MRALTLMKLRHLLPANDHIPDITAKARLTQTDWLLYDLVLVHEDINVIGEDTKVDEEQEALVELFFKVQECSIEELSGEKLVDAWLKLTKEYNEGNRKCSSMLLQRRWYQLKERTRNRFYNFWWNYHGNPSLLRKACEMYKASELLVDIGRAYRHIITQPFPSWTDMIKEKKVILLDEFKARIYSQRVTNLSKFNPSSQVIEIPIGTITHENDSTNESSDYLHTKDKTLPRKDASNTDKFCDINIKKKQILIDDDNIDTALKSINDSPTGSNNIEKRNTKEQARTLVSIGITEENEAAIEISAKIINDEDVVIQDFKKDMSNLDFTLPIITNVRRNTITVDAKQPEAGSYVGPKCPVQLNENDQLIAETVMHNVCIKDIVDDIFDNSLEAKESIVNRNLSTVTDINRNLSVQKQKGSDVKNCSQKEIDQTNYFLDNFLRDIDKTLSYETEIIKDEAVVIPDLIEDISNLDFTLPIITNVTSNTITEVAKQPEENSYVGSKCPVQLNELDQLIAENETVMHNVCLQDVGNDIFDISLEAKESIVNRNLSTVADINCNLSVQKQKERYVKNCSQKEIIQTSYFLDDFFVDIEKTLSNESALNNLGKIPSGIQSDHDRMVLEDNGYPVKKEVTDAWLVDIRKNPKSKCFKKLKFDNLQQELQDLVCLEETSVCCDNISTTVTSKEITTPITALETISTDVVAEIMSPNKVKHLPDLNEMPCVNQNLFTAEASPIHTKIATDFILAPANINKFQTSTSTINNHQSVYNIHKQYTNRVANTLYIAVKVLNGPIFKMAQKEEQNSKIQNIKEKNKPRPPIPWFKNALNFTSYNKHKLLTNTTVDRILLIFTWENLCKHTVLVTSIVKRKIKRQMNKTSASKKRRAQRKMNRKNAETTKKCYRNRVNINDNVNLTKTDYTIVEPNKEGGKVPAQHDANAMNNANNSFEEIQSAVRSIAKPCYCWEKDNSQKVESLKKPWCSNAICRCRDLLVNDSLRRYDKEKTELSNGESPNDTPSLSTYIQHTSSLRKTEYSSNFRKFETDTVTETGASSTKNNLAYFIDISEDKLTTDEYYDNCVNVTKHLDSIAIDNSKNIDVLSDINRKTLLSDLMEMSGIRNDDIETSKGQHTADENQPNVAIDKSKNIALPNINRKMLLSNLVEISGITEGNSNTSNLSQLETPFQEWAIEVHGTNMVTTYLGEYQPSSHNKIDDFQITLGHTVFEILASRPNLHIITSFDEFKCASQKKATFFKLDVMSGEMVSFNMYSQKKQKFLLRKAEASVGVKECIDLTDDVEDTQVSSSSREGHSKILNKKTENVQTAMPIKLFRSIHPSIVRKRKGNTQTYDTTNNDIEIDVINNVAQQPPYKIYDNEPLEKIVKQSYDSKTEPEYKHELDMPHI
ncbi:uncharacterized protein LOC126970963 [Leptidea sinapis]|uniref:uncharacterized protein LOC126970963 n=1 Tax=Leptidea sinapis TaxID=189913 RepID=UPI0021C33FB5|nr:uncharacterized protein LOC126970963 [Leptidea sinapis]